MLVDSHCHLNYEQLADTAGVIARAKEAGVGLFQTISTQRSDFAEVKALADTYPEIYCSIGVHPHEAEPHEDISEQELLEAANHPKVIGIGETGLDYYYEHSPREAQKTLFRRHITVARKLDLPVIVHSRDADEDTVEILKDETSKGSFRFLIHCFSSSQYLAEESVKLGGYISLSGIITFKKSQTLRDATSCVPLDRLLVETDSPYLAPEPYRGKPCEPAYTKFTAQKLADMRGMSYEDVATKTTENFFRLFSKAKALNH
ncbi:MAG: TatD family hydrolase [Alphaproteobacteria bacterium]|nr:TatD family hydrolase [Alphaproteobacteria bacterium]